MIITKPGLYPDLSNQEYHAQVHALSNSMCKVLLEKSPKHLKESPPAHSTAFDFGTAAHTVILEPEKMDTIVCGPETRRGSAWTDMVADNPDKIVLTKSDYDKLGFMRDSVWSVPHIAEMLGANDQGTEISAFAEIEGVLCKVRVDRVIPRVILDLKTTIDASPEGFNKSVVNYKYYIQSYLYRRIWAVAAGERRLRDFVFICVEKEPPYAAASFRLDAIYGGIAAAHFQVALKLFKWCHENDKWPGYDNRTRLLQPPQWMSNA